MRIGNKEYEEIMVVGKNNELIASITDQNIIEKQGIKIVCVPHRVRKIKHGASDALKKHCNSTYLKMVNRFGKYTVVDICLAGKTILSMIEEAEIPLGSIDEIFEFVKSSLKTYRITSEERKKTVTFIKAGEKRE